MRDQVSRDIAQIALREYGVVVLDTLGVGVLFLQH